MGLKEKPIFYCMEEIMRKPIDFEVNKVAADGNDVVLKTNFIKNAKKICIQRMVATDETTNTKAVTFGVKSGAEERWFETVLLTTATYYYGIKEPIFINGDCQLLFKFHSPTAGDVLKGFAFGYYDC